MTYVKISQKQFRNCSAKIFTATVDSGEKLYLLRSYASNVCEIYRDRNVWYVTLFPRWNYSVTTNQHVRKFMKDVMGYSISVPMIRDIMKCKVEEGRGVYFRHNIDPEHENACVVFKREWQELARRWWENHGVYGEWGF